MELPLVAVSFRPYGLTHWILLVVTVVGGVLLIWLGRRYRDSPAAETFTRIFAVLQLIVTLGFMIIWLVPPFFDLHQSLPLQLSDILRLVTAYALWSRRDWAFALTYYWGLTLNPQAILTPDLQLDVAPVLQFASYWLQHVLVMWAAVYLTWGLGLRPTWRSYRQALAVTVAWAVFVFVINRLLGTNYGYLNGKPGSASLLDLMGRWPWYLLVAFAVLAAVWALITWPWTMQTQAQRRRCA